MSPEGAKASASRSSTSRSAARVEGTVGTLAQGELNAKFKTKKKKKSIDFLDLVVSGLGGSASRRSFLKEVNIVPDFSDVRD